jgi:general secretion pathway protein N
VRAGLIAIGVLAATVAVEAVALPGAPPTAPLPAPALPAAPVRPPAADLTAWTAAILARPLFRSDRRALAAAAGPAAALPRLSAIVVTAAGALAIFSPADGSAPVTAGTGSAVDGYKLVRISPDDVTLRGPDGVERTVVPQFAAPAAPATPAAPPIMPPLQQDHF